MNGLGIVAGLGCFPEKFSAALKQEKPSICDNFFTFAFQMKEK